MADRNAIFGTENFVGSNASSGAMCTGDINQRGSYAPLGNNASWGAPNFSRLGEMTSESSVPSEKDQAFGIFNYVSAPQGLVTVKNAAG